MRISDWSSDVCSSDLNNVPKRHISDKWYSQNTVKNRSCKNGSTTINWRHTMNHFLCRGALAALAASSFVFGAASSQAAGYPSKPISIVVGYPAGGSVDFTARALRSEARRVGKEGVSTGRARWAREHKKK